MQVQRLTPDQVQRMPGLGDTYYHLDRPPFTRYRWDGARMVAGMGAIETTFATLPAAADFVGFAWLTDIGPHGSLWRSDGTLWTPVNGCVSLYRSAVAAAVLTGTTAQTSRFTLPIKGGLMGPDGALRIRVKTSATNNANTKNIFFYFGGGVIATYGFQSSLTAGFEAVIENRGATNSQISANNTGTGFGAGTAFSTAAVDTTVDQTLGVVLALANGADSITLESVSVELLKY